VAPGRQQARLLPESVPVSYALDRTGTIDLDVPATGLEEHDFPLLRPLGRIEGRIMVAVDPLAAGTNPAAAPAEVPRVRVILDGTQFTTTDREGRFSFRRLVAGTHEIRIDPATLPFGVRVEGEGTTRVVVSADRETVATCAFRIFRPIQRQVF
jgi:hypothetical protein